MGKYLDKIITEAIDKMLITEMTSSRCYHFCTWPTLVAIASNNQFALRTNVTSRSEHWNQPNRRFYMSLSRVADGRVGYQSYFSNEDILCRIELDGDKLSDRYRIRPVNWVENGNFDTKEKREDRTKRGQSTSKERYTKAAGNGHIPYFARVQDEVENEDRVFSDKPIIPNAYSYIKRIDIFLQNTHNFARDYMSKKEIADERAEVIKMLLRTFDVKWMDKLHFFDTMHNFNTRKNEIPFNKLTQNDKQYSNILSNNKRQNNAKWMDMYVTTLAQGIGCIGQIVDAIVDDPIQPASHYAKPWIEKYHLTELINSVPDDTQFKSALQRATIDRSVDMLDLTKNRFFYILETMENSVRTINKQAPNNIYTIRALKMITDFVKSTGCDTISTTTQKSYGKSIYLTLINKLEEKLIKNHE